MVLKSYKKLNLKGVDLDRLLIKIYNQKIRIFNIKRPNHNEIEFIINNNDYQSIKRYLTSYECVVEDIGLKKIKKNFLNHISVFVCAVIIVFCAIFSSNFIWKIDINGTENLSKNEIVSLLADNGVKCGSQKFLSVVDIEKILLTNNRIAQVSCYYRGTTLMINISEKLVYVPEDYPPIVAKYNGIITDYTLIKGTINFVKGEYVNKGDILVYPYIIDKNGNKVLVEPEAEINGKIFINEATTISEKQNILVKSGKTHTNYHIAYKRTNKIYNKDKNPFVFFETNVYNEYISSILPFVRQKVVYYELIEETKNNDFETLKPICEKECLDKALSKALDIGVVIDEYTHSVVVNDMLYTNATVECKGSII